MTESFTTDFKRFFLRGLAVLLPTMITIAIIVYVLSFVDGYIGKHLNHGLQWIVVQFWRLVERTEFTWSGPDAVWDRVKAIWADYQLWWLGFLLAIGLIYVLGRFVASFLGRTVWQMVERAFARTPVLKQVYPYVKQVTDFLLSERKVEFSRVVAVEYPRRGLWSLGLVTGPGMKQLREAATHDLLTVFIPSSPTPVTGYTITVRRDEVIDLPVSIDEALRFTVSGGVIMPRSQELSRAEVEQARQGTLPGRIQEGDDQREHRC